MESQCGLYPDNPYLWPCAPAKIQLYAYYGSDGRRLYLGTRLPLPSQQTRSDYYLSRALGLRRIYLVPHYVTIRDN